MKEFVAKLETIYNALSMRERILICMGVISLVYGVWHTTLYDYILATDSDIAKKMGDIKEQINLLEGKIDSMSEVVGRDPTYLLIEQSKSLKKESDFLDKKIDEKTKAMLSSKEMVTVLRNIISKTEGLSLINMESLSSKPLFESKMIKSGSGPKRVQAFTHNLKIELLGGYFELVGFLKSVEKQNPSIVWDILDYEVIKYPKAKITIYLHTVGIDEGWVGV